MASPPAMSGGAEPTTPKMPETITAKFIFPQNDSTVEDYSGQHSVHDTPWGIMHDEAIDPTVVKLLFRGRRLTEEEERLTFGELMQKVVRAVLLSVALTA